MQAFYSVIPHVKRGLKITDIMKFEWEKKSEPMSTEDFERVKNRFRNLKSIK